MTRRKGIPAGVCSCGCDYIPWPSLAYSKRLALAAAVEAEYGRICWLCLRPIAPGAYSVDHVIPDSRHGGHDLSNLRPAHGRCNSARGNRSRKPLAAALTAARRSWTDD